MAYCRWPTAGGCFLRREFPDHVPDSSRPKGRPYPRFTAGSRARFPSCGAPLRHVSAIEKCLMLQKARGGQRKTLPEQEKTLPEQENCAAGGLRPFSAPELLGGGDERHDRIGDELGRDRGEEQPGDPGDEGRSAVPKHPVHHTREP